MPQSLTQDSDQARPGGWVSFEERENVTPVQNRHGACGLGNSICRSLFAIQNRKLAEYLAGLNHCQQQLLASRGRHADADGSAEQSHHLVAGRADGEDGFARVKRPHTRKGGDLGPLLGTQAAKQTAIQEKLAGFLERPFVRTHGVVSPRGVSELIDARLSRDHHVPRSDGAVNQKRSRSSKSRSHMYDSHTAFIYGASPSPAAALGKAVRNSAVFSRCEVAHTYRCRPRSILRPLKMPIRRSLFSIAGSTASGLWSRKEIGNAQNSSYRRGLRRGCNDDDHGRLELRCARTESGDRDRRRGSGGTIDRAVRDHGKARQKPSHASMGRVLSSPD